MMLQIKFDCNFPTGLRDIHVWKCKQTHGRTHGRRLDLYTISSPCEPSAQVTYKYCKAQMQHILYITFFFHFINEFYNSNYHSIYCIYHISFEFLEMKQGRCKKIYFHKNNEHQMWIHLNWHSFSCWAQKQGCVQDKHFIQVFHVKDMLANQLRWVFQRNLQYITY